MWKIGTQQLYTFSYTLTILVAASVFDKSYFPSLTKNAFGAQLFGGKQAPFEHVNRTGNIFTHITIIHLCLHAFSNLTADDGLHSIEKMLGSLRLYHYYPNLYLSLLALTLPSPRGLLRTYNVHLVVRLFVHGRFFNHAHKSSENHFAPFSTLSCQSSKCQGSDAPHYTTTYLDITYISLGQIFSPSYSCEIWSNFLLLFFSGVTSFGFRFAQDLLTYVRRPPIFLAFYKH